MLGDIRCIYKLLLNPRVNKDIIYYDMTMMIQRRNEITRQVARQIA